jgi:PPOX class probable F420-dependent enzyme
MSAGGNPRKRASIPVEFLDLLTSRALAHLATMRPGCTPQITPVWIDHEDGLLLVSAREDRVKTANMLARPAVAISIVDPGNPYRYLAIEGIVESAEEDRDLAHMDKLSRRYLGVDRYPWGVEGERRVLFRIRPLKVSADAGKVAIPTEDQQPARLSSDRVERP